MKTLKVRLGPRSYNIIIASGILKELARMLSTYSDITKVMLITDKNVARFYGPIVTESLRPYKLEAAVATIEPGEEQKSLPTAEVLYERLFQHGMDRKGLVVALGGGVVGDIAGYVAATYMRGIPYIQAPTTLVAQVDSSIGGKVAVNHPKGKNMIGCFYQPRAVYIDPSVLKTLPREELTQGLVEVIKYGVIRDAGLFNYLEAHIEELLGLDPEVLEKVIATCCRIKAWVVHKDEREETGLRSILNYGHTLGHAIEAVERYKGYRHGEAVATGMVLATRIALLMGLAEKEVLERQKNLLRAAGAPTDYHTRDIQEIFAFLRRDKKALAGRLNLILPTKIGKVVLKEVPEEMVREVLTSG